MDINELFKKSLEISLNIKFNVWIKQKDLNSFIFLDKKEMTYMELGLYLINNSTNIIRIEILLKE